MRCALRWTLVAIMMLAALPAMAGKIGFVEVEKALWSVKEGRAKFQELEKWSTPRQQQLEELGGRLAELRQLVVQQANVASPEALQRLQEEELDARRRLEDSTREFQRDLDVKQNEVLKDVARKFNAVVTDYAEANGYDAVFILKDSMLVYLAEAADLSDEIIALYDQRFPVGQ